jgi:GTP-binding protein HflX
VIRIDDKGNVTERESVKAILAGVTTGGDISYSMEELGGLAEAAGIEVLASVVQSVEKINAATSMGSGKLEEMKEAASNMGADMLIFNDELSGMQIRNIEDAVGVKVIDRTILILDIFADRAQTKEAQLQVELAQLQYRMPRLTGFGKALSRLGGGIGTRGPGEKQLETDRRHIRRRMDDIRAELAEVKAGRGTQRARREKSGIPVVALVGYTNAGKSSIMNRLLAMDEREEKQVFEKDMLFATLDTSQRRITTDGKHSFILIDTVGFVGKLPHTLIDAFKATLEEVSMADLLLHVVDASLPGHDYQIQVTEKVLSELGAGDRPTILVYNKKDKVPGFDALGRGQIAVSARFGDGIDELIEMIKENVFAGLKTVDLLIPYTRGDLVSLVNEKTQPEKTAYLAEGTYIRAELGEAERGKLEEFIIDAPPEGAGL